jgi:transcriptional regulator with XRE-family HTH domain
MKIGNVIRELRKEKGFTQAQLAREIGVSQKAIDYWERDVNEPKLSYIMALVKTFDISYDEFFAEIE